MQEKLAQIDEVREDVVLQEVEVILLEKTERRCVVQNINSNT